MSNLDFGAFFSVSPTFHDSTERYVVNDQQNPFGLAFKTRVSALDLSMSDMEGANIEMFDVSQFVNDESTPESEEDELTRMLFIDDRKVSLGDLELGRLGQNCSKSPESISELPHLSTTGSSSLVDFDSSNLDLSGISPQVNVSYANNWFTGSRFSPSSTSLDLFPGSSADFVISPVTKLPDFQTSHELCNKDFSEFRFATQRKSPAKTQSLLHVTAAEPFHPNLPTSFFSLPNNLTEPKSRTPADPTQVDTPVPRKAKRKRIDVTSRAPKRQKVRTAEEESVKRRRFLDRNRLAAHRCRQTKKEKTSELVARAAILQEERQEILLELEAYRSEVRRLRELLTVGNHDCASRSENNFKTESTEEIKLEDCVQEEVPLDDVFHSDLEDRND